MTLPSISPAPAGLYVDRTRDGGFGVFAQRAFAKGETVYHGHRQTRELPADPTQPVAQLVTAQGEIVKVIPAVHWVPIDLAGNCDVYQFDCMMNHACQPNTVCRFADGGNYTHVATQPIAAGAQVTVDYRTIGYAPAQLPQFDCACGAVNCNYDWNAC